VAERLTVTYKRLHSFSLIIQNSDLVRILGEEQCSWFFLIKNGSITFTGKMKKCYQELKIAPESFTST
jgi:hypothetical protein